ncbi:MAG: gliding motility-associated C-terminal domain-containing protein [Sphingobacteriales bacterium]|nr:gliding motility-associated C-terminal domain-containing protein [Sphingobacteriales bacterium]
MAGLFASGQNPATTFTIPNRLIQLPCGTSCTSISAQVPHIRQTDDYVVTNPAYVPFDYVTAGGIDVRTLISGSYYDDQWTSKVPVTFPFCFYGITYPTLLIGTNSAITFDTSRAGSNSGYSISASNGGIPKTTYAPSMIFGPYHDIDIDEPASNKRIEYRIEGTAPRRRFIVSYNEVPYFGSSCGGNMATHMMVLYESTGIVEVYIKDKPFCTGWNNGMTILGMQNQTRTAAVAAPGKNATQWGTAGMDSCWRFTPSGGASRLKSAQLLVNGTVVANADTSTASPGILDLSFPDVCPAGDSTAYEIRVTYGQCNNPAADVVFSDTVYVKKDQAPLLSFTKTDASCTGYGSITLTATGGGPATKEYSIDNGATYQASNIFNNLAAGTYNLKVRNTGSTCASATQQATILVTDDLTLSAGNGGTICFGASFTPSVQGNATSYTWAPAAGVSNPAVANPVLSPQITTTYTVTATLGTCTKQGTVTVTVVPGATANAGADAIIVAGDSYQIHATGSAGNYLWTPSTGLSSATILSPKATPAGTTTYSLQVTTPQGCVATDDIQITVIPYCIKPMNAFTPNGDGINEKWLVTNGNCLSSAKAQVFNRYGAKVFESGDYKNTWDGSYEGKPLPDGTYYYVITYTLLNGKTEYLKGNVTILR